MSDRTAEVVWEGDLRAGSGRATFGSGSLPAVGMTWASRTEAPGGGTSPEELIAAAHAGCYAMGLANLLAREEHRAESLRVAATVTFEVLESGPKITRSALSVTGRVPGVDASAFEDAARRGEQRCPVSNALRGNVELTLEAKLEG
ncbi:MAG: OsmC family peroxiredoxin [Candidatus Dormibacterales bacterium]